MQAEYKRAIKLALGEKRLWVAALLSALFFSQAWWIIFDWGPEYLGGRWESAVGERLGDAAAFVTFLIAALAAFVVIRAIAYLAEMILIRQVATGQNGDVPTFSHAFASSRRRYIPFAVTLLPWDALRVTAIYLPALIIALWNRWDPHYDHIGLYLLVLLLWLIILVAVYMLAGITAMLAARFSLLEGEGVQDSWREGWALFMLCRGKCLMIWLQALAADIGFIALAWPLSALIPWGVGLYAADIGFAPLRWLIYCVVYIVMAAGLIIALTGVQCYKSSLWTTFFLELTWEERVETIIFQGLPGA